MKIEILDAADPVHGTPYVLLAGGLESPEDLRRNAAVLTQLMQGMRAVSSNVVNRGAFTHDFEFQCTRTYDDVKAAETAIFDHPAAVPTSGIIRFTTEGSSPNVRYLRNATVRAFAAQQIGISVLWHYTITGGDLSSTAPT